MTGKFTLSSQKGMLILCILNIGMISIFTILCLRPQIIKLFPLTETAERTYLLRLEKGDDSHHHSDVFGIQNITTINAEALGKTLSQYRTIFKNSYSEDEMKVQLQIMDVFDAAMKNASIPYFIYGGTLIGSWRHHGQIPWDDDVDIAVPSEQKERVRNTLTALTPAFRLDTKFEIRWKLYSYHSSMIRGTSYGWPFIDINFYRSNTTHVCDEDKAAFPNFCYPIDIIFPLRERPFMNRMFPAPAKTGEVLKLTYDLNMCLIGIWNHRIETWREKKDQHMVPCKDLESLHPFVRRTRVKNQSCNETLFHNSKATSWFLNEYEVC